MGIHRSFQLSPNPDLIDKRVVPRLLRIHRVIGIARAVSVIGAMLTFLLICKNVEVLNPNKNVAVVLLWFLIPAITDYLTFESGRLIASRMGYLGRNELDGFERFMRRWPESWLEDRT